MNVSRDVNLTSERKDDGSQQEQIVHLYGSPGRQLQRLIWLSIVLLVVLVLAIQR